MRILYIWQIACTFFVLKKTKSNSLWISKTGGHWYLWNQKCVQNVRVCVRAFIHSSIDQIGSTDGWCHMAIGRIIIMFVRMTRNEMKWKKHIVNIFIFFLRWNIRFTHTHIHRHWDRPTDTERINDVGNKRKAAEKKHCFHHCMDPKSVCMSLSIFNVLRSTCTEDAAIP